MPFRLRRNVAIRKLYVAFLLAKRALAVSASRGEAGHVGGAASVWDALAELAVRLTHRSPCGVTLLQSLSYGCFISEHVREV